MMRKTDEGVIEPARTGLGVRFSTHSSRVDLPEPRTLAPNAEPRRDVDAEIRARQQVHVGAPEHRRRQPVQRGDDVAREFRKRGVEHRPDVRHRFEPGLVVVGDRRDFCASRRLGPAFAGGFPLLVQGVELAEAEQFQGRHAGAIVGKARRAGRPHRGRRRGRTCRDRSGLRSGAS